MSIQSQHAVSFNNNDMQRHLSFLWLELTNKCNLHCTHCYAESSPTSNSCNILSVKDWKQIIADGVKLHCQSISFIGGEPLLHPSIKALAQYARENGYNIIEIYTNGLLLNDELITFAKSNNLHIAISFYSLRQEIHETITRKKGSFSKTLSAIKKSLKANLPLRVGIIKMKENWNDIDQTRDYLTKLGVRKIGIDRVRRVGRSTKIKSSNNNGEQFEELCGNCWKGRLCVSENGRAYPCVFSRKTDLGDVRIGLEEIISSKKLLNFRDKVEKFNKQRKMSQFSSSCGPDHHDTCGPDWKIHTDPNPSPCSPDSSCGPDDKTCGPDVLECNPDRCNPDKSGIICRPF